MHNEGIITSVNVVGRRRISPIRLPNDAFSSLFFFLNLNFLIFQEALKLRSFHLHSSDYDGWAASCPCCLSREWYFILEFFFSAGKNFCTRIFLGEHGSAVLERTSHHVDREKKRESTKERKAWNESAGRVNEFSLLKIPVCSPPLAYRWQIPLVLLYQLILEINPIFDKPIRLQSKIYYMQWNGQLLTLKT